MAESVSNLLPTSEASCSFVLILVMVRLTFDCVPFLNFLNKIVIAVSWKRYADQVDFLFKMVKYDDFIEEHQMRFGLR